jgi:sortase A
LKEVGNAQAAFSAKQINFVCYRNAGGFGMKKQTISHIYTLVLVIIFFVGLALLLYPSVSDYWNSLHQSKAIAEYNDIVAQMDSEEYNRVLSAAVEYNSKLPIGGSKFTLTDEERQIYNSMLNISPDGTMSYIEIPSINCTLPIYHGTSNSVLEVGVGHLEGSSLPVGGESTHCVLSSHRGLPSAKLFTNLDKLVEGDIFMLRTLDEVITYEVDQILIVLPDDVSALNIERGKDYCTLVTCTPYGVNTHRLLVRGHRIPNLTESEEVRITGDATQIEPIVAAPFAAIPIVIVIWLWFMITTRKKPNAVDESIKIMTERRKRTYEKYTQVQGQVQGQGKDEKL